MVAPMSMAAAFGCTMGSCGRPWTSIHCGSSPILLLPKRKGWAAQLVRFLNGIAGDGVATLKCATAHGPGFLTGLHATKVISAAPFRPQSSGSAFLSHRERAALRSVF